MSEIGVKIYEVKRDIQRMHLVGHVSGKDGAKQAAIFVNSDTLEPIETVLFKKRGFYSFKEIVYGKEIFEDRGPRLDTQTKKEADIYITDQSFDHGDGQARTVTGTYFVTQDNCSFRINGFTDIHPSTEIAGYYLVFKYDDDH